VSANIDLLERLRAARDDWAIDITADPTQPPGQRVPGRGPSDMSWSALGSASARGDVPGLLTQRPGNVAVRRELCFVSLRVPRMSDQQIHGIAQPRTRWTTVTSPVQTDMLAGSTAAALPAAAAANVSGRV
jgi:hypothetical protein